MSYLNALTTWLHRHTRGLLPLGAFLALAGFFGPWVNHAAAGLVITGLDLPEYVKFLPAMLAGQLTLWREGFYLPLVAVSMALSLHAFDARLRYGWFARSLLLGTALVAACTAAIVVNPECFLMLVDSLDN